MKMTQLEAQSALTAHMASTQGLLPIGAAVTLLWVRSYLQAETLELRHEFQAYGFDLRGTYVDETVQDSALRDIVCIYFDVCGKKG